MINDLFINGCILITFISIAYQMFKGNEVDFRTSLKVKVLFGLYSGVLGIFLMLYSVNINSHIIIDFRNIPLIVISIYGGFIPTIISAGIMGAFRLLHFGVTDSSVIANVVLILISVCCSYISEFKISVKQKWIFCTVTTLLISNVAIAYLLGKLTVIVTVLPLYCIGTILATVLTYMYTQYLNEAATLFRKLKEDSTHDFLTGLNNVRSFDTKYNSAIRQAVEKSEKLSILFIDIDFFKKVNDAYGHHNGDIVLKELSKLLIYVCRSFDVVSRNGGEEFSVLLFDCPASHAVQIGEKIRKKVESSEFELSDSSKIKITVSIGIATYPDTDVEHENLINWADSALYTAKQNGRNRVVLYQQNY